MEFKRRDYRAEEVAFSLPRQPASPTHPLGSSTAISITTNQEEVSVDNGSMHFFDPLRELSTTSEEPVEGLEVVEEKCTSSKASVRFPAKEWMSFKKFLMQRYPVPKLISISSMSSKIIRSNKVVAIEKLPSSTHSYELDDSQKLADEGSEVISQQWYVSRLHELKDDITRAWHSNDRVTSLKLSVKVARLLMDTSVLQFYPTVFVLVTDVLDMLGDMVWERIRQRAEYTEDGTLICSLPDNFEARNICFDAKETCNNWFCKIGSIHELLPRIYLELAMFPCWRFLHDRFVDSLMRLVKMTRGIADPLASAYCRLYLVHCAQKLPLHDIGYLITCIHDLNGILSRIVSVKEIAHGNLSEERTSVSLIEPTVEYVLKCTFKDLHQKQVEDIVARLGLGHKQSELFGNFPCASLVLHHLLKELPVEVVWGNAVEFLYLIECSDDFSFDKCLNFKILGLKLCEGVIRANIIDAVIDKVIQVASQKIVLEEYLKIVDAYVDIVLQHQMDSCLTRMLSGIFERVSDEKISEAELSCLQSVFMKILTHFDNIEDIFNLYRFGEILSVMHGSSRSIVSMHILAKATKNGRISDSTAIQILFDVAQCLHDNADLTSMKRDDNHQPERLISRFVEMVDHGPELQLHMAFLVECRGAFGRMNELKETLVHSSNHLAVKAMRDGRDHLSIIKSSLAFSEVTIPSIPSHCSQLNLYLETAEVALLGGLISHADGLLDSAVCCLQNVYSIDGLMVSHVDVDGIISSIRKLCSLLLILPGNPIRGVMHFPICILSYLDSQSWVTSRMRIQVLCSVLSLCAVYSQDELPYHAKNHEVIGNDILFFGYPACSQELLLLSGIILQNIINMIPQEPSQAARGKLALEACNFIASVFEVSPEICEICSKLVETAKLSLGAEDKYLLSTISTMHKLQQRVRVCN